MEARAIARHARLRSEKTNVETQREQRAPPSARMAVGKRLRRRGRCPREKNVVRHSVKTERTKGAWGMPWLSEAKKDVTKSRKAAGRGKCPVIADVRMGQPAGSDPASRRAGGERWELKHLKYRREEKVTTIPQ